MFLKEPASIGHLKDDVLALNVQVHHFSSVHVRQRQEHLSYRHVARRSRGKKDVETNKNIEKVTIPKM